MNAKIKGVVEACQAAAAATDVTAYYNMQWWTGAAFIAGMALIFLPLAFMMWRS